MSRPSVKFTATTRRHHHNEPPPHHQRMMIQSLLQPGRRGGVGVLGRHHVMARGAAGQDNQMSAILRGDDEQAMQNTQGPHGWRRDVLVQVLDEALRIADEGHLDPFVWGVAPSFSLATEESTGAIGIMASFAAKEDLSVSVDAGAAAGDENGPANENQGDSTDHDHAESS